MYSLRSSTHSLQCWIGLVKRRRPLQGKESEQFIRLAVKDAPFPVRIRKCRSFDRPFEEFAQLLPERQPRAVQAALHRRYGEVERLGNVLI